MRLDYERGRCYYWETRSWQLPSAAGCGVSMPDRAKCGAASGAGISDLDPVTMIRGGW